MRRGQGERKELAALRAQLTAALADEGVTGGAARTALDEAAIAVWAEARGLRAAGVEAATMATSGDGEAARATRVDVTAALRAAGLGEQPVSVLGAWSELGRGTGEEARGAPRRAHGAWYTPPELAQLVADAALGETIRTIRARWSAGERTAASLAAWRAELRAITVVDPACGAGAFLLAAGEVLTEALTEVEGLVERVAGQAPGAPTAGLPAHAVLDQLHGCDLDPHAVAVGRATLRLAAGLPASAPIPGGAPGPGGAPAGPHLHVGDALAPLAGPPWHDDRFAVVLGNPPFVRHERLAALKPRLRGWRVYDGSADLYVYFVERAHALLAPGGRLGLVLPGKWLRAGYAAPLRAWLAGEVDVERVIDFGHAALFAGADAFPSVLVARRRGLPPAPPTSPSAPSPSAPSPSAPSPSAPSPSPPLAAVLARGAALTLPSVDAASFPLPLPAGEAPWALVPPALARVFARLAARGRPLAEVAGGAPLYGVKTGCNDAFLVDLPTRDALVAADPACAAVLRPYLRGQDLAAWAPGPAREWILALRSSDDHPWPWSDAADPASTFAATFPAVAAHLARFEPRLRARADQGRHWWELRACRYYDAFDRPRVLYPDLCWAPAFAWTREPTWADNTVYLLPCDDPWLVAALHAPVTWAWLWAHAVHGKDEVLRLKSPTVAALPVPLPSPADRALAAALVPRLQAGPDEGARRALAAAVHAAFGLTAADEVALAAHRPPRSPG